MDDGMILTFPVVQTYAVDAFTLYTAYAIATVPFLRSAGFGFSIFAPSMYNPLGYSEGNTVLAVVAIIFAMCMRVL
ncbi:hypothetical protein L208DRAFT_1468828 [Tricholoma matsutake]|nr:hypothetical protein L208DRAFT_1468828 [Tricholoma matsutake 945]